LDPYPIQIIRQNFSKDFIPFTNYSHDLVCPPFISRDVGIISTGTEILKELIGNDLSNINIIFYGHELKNISSFYNHENSNIINNLPSIIIPINDNNLKQQINAEDIEIHINNWDDLLEYIWMIRFYGGIDSSYSCEYALIVGKEISKFVMDLLQ
jgi:hypothetical protein